MSAADAADDRRPAHPAAPAERGVNIEKWGWIYMRASGVVLVVLIFGHLFVNLVARRRREAIDFAFVAGKFANPFWQVWDVADALARAHPRRQRHAHDHRTTTRTPLANRCS